MYEYSDGKDDNDNDVDYDNDVGDDNVADNHDFVDDFLQSSGGQCRWPWG